MNDGAAFDVRTARIVVVSPTELLETPKIDFTFCLFVPFKAVVDRAWGLLSRVDGSGSVNPFKGMQEGDWSSPEFRWNMNLFQDGKLIEGGGVDGDEQRRGLASLLAKVPDCIMLVPRDDLEQVRRACEIAKLATAIFEVEAPLSMSGNTPPRELLDMRVSHQGYPG